MSETNNDVGLFSKNKLYIISDAKGIAENELNKINKGEDIFIFFLENSPKVKTIKNIFLKRSDSLVFDCYELSKELKTRREIQSQIDENGAQKRLRCQGGSRR